MEEDEDLPLMLRKPLLATGSVFIDVLKIELTMRVLDEEVSFNVYSALKLSNFDVSSCYRIDVCEPLTNEWMEETIEDD